MTDAKDVAHGQVSPLAHTAVNVVRDAFELVLDRGDEYVESAVAIEKLEFASNVVGGLAAAATTPAAGSVRSASTVTVPLADSQGGEASASLTVALYGPGDVRGLEHTQIVRRFPRPDSRTAEETVLAHVEFDRPELPWAFSAEPPSPLMRPWLTLVVAERRHVEWEPATSAMLPIMRVPLDELPTLDDRVHLWAHAQAPRTDLPQEASLSARLSPAHAPVNLSRLLSPRILRDATDYVAAIVPTTDVGVRGGLGLDGGTLDPAWTSSSPDPVRLPVYDSWTFRTGPDGDFKSLALELEGVVAPYEVGRRFIDTSTPGLPLRELGPAEAGRKQVLRCALFSPTPAPPEHAAAEAAAWGDDMVADLRQELDRPAMIEGAAPRTGGIPDLPIVGPRIYASLQRGSPVIAGDDWFADLNLAPTTRIIAGLGTRVVQKDQEQLMQAAWAQVGEVQAANRMIRLAQFAELAAARLHARLDGLQGGRLLQVVGPMAPRVQRAVGATLQGAVAHSATPTTVLGGAFRRMTRPGGPVVGRADSATRVRAGAVVGADGTMRDFTRTYRNPDGIGGLSAGAIATLDLDRAATVLGVPTHDVAATVGHLSDTVAGAGTLASHLTRPESWQPIEPGFDLSTHISTRWAQRLAREPDDPVIRSVRTERIGPLVADLASTGQGIGGEVRDRLVARAVVLNDRLLDKFRVTDGPGVDDVVVPVDGTIVGAGRTRIDATIAIDDRISARLRDRIRDGRIGDVAEGRVGAGRVGVTGGFGRVQPLPAAEARVVLRPLRDGARIGTRDLPQLRHLTDAPVARQREGLQRFAQLADVRVAPLLDKVAALSLTDLRAQLPAIVDPGGVLAIDKVPHRDTLDVAAAEVRALTNPSVTIKATLTGRLQLAGAVAGRWAATPTIEPIMAAPIFLRPMYRALEAWDRDWLVPGLGLLPDADFVTVLSTNSQFIEAFLVGLSDEMGRELLWRNYPTDRRGTYFRRFWRPRDDDLDGQVHAFPPTGLGSHVSLGDGDGRAVIVVKSELVRRFPDLIIQAVRNKSGDQSRPVFETDDEGQETAEELFAEHLEPDIALVGLNLSVRELDEDEDWWIVIAEHPSATRFERPDDDDLPDSQVFLDDTAPHAARYASDHLHDPVRVAFQATDLIIT